MAYCTKCGQKLDDNAKFCTSCGEKVANSTHSFSDTISELGRTHDSSSSFDKKDIESNKIIALFSYIGILFIIPLIAAKDSKYARYHANQGLTFFLASLILSAFAFSMSFVFAFIPLLNIVANGVSFAVTAVDILYTVLGIVNAVTGVAKELPIIGKYTFLK